MCVRTGVACVWLAGFVRAGCGVQAVRVSVCVCVFVWNVLSVCVMRLVCRPGMSMKILNDRPWCEYEDFEHV